VYVIRLNEDLILDHEVRQGLIIRFSERMKVGRQQGFAAGDVDIDDNGL